MNISLKAFAVVAATLISLTALAQDLERGPEIGATAGNCAVGAFGQTQDAGDYEGSCTTLSREEVCLAYIKMHMDEIGHVDAADDPAKATFCMNLLKHSLLTE